MSNRTLPANVNLGELKIVGKTLKVKSNSNPIQVHADYGCWDTSANKNVSVEDTNFKDPS